ncbi:MAG: hypothetical protein ABUL69_00990, partial [Peristeroidobacter soli]
EQEGHQPPADAGIQGIEGGIVALWHVGSFIGGGGRNIDTVCGRRRPAPQNGSANNFKKTFQKPLQNARSTL